MSYRVIAPLVVAKDQSGFNRHRYHGAIIPWLSEAQAAHFLRLRLVEVIPEPVAAPAPVVAEVENAVNAVVTGVTGKPAKVASKEAWVEYGVTQGQDRDELEKLNKPDLVDLLG
jgi:hypothetical protein